MDCYYFDDDFCLYHGELCANHPICNGFTEGGE